MFFFSTTVCWKPCLHLPSMTLYLVCMKPRFVNGLRNGSLSYGWTHVLKGSRILYSNRKQLLFLVQSIVSLDLAKFLPFVLLPGLSLVPQFFPKTHASFDSCVRAKLELLFYFPLVQVLAQPVCKFQHLFNCQVRIFKPTSLSDAPLTSMPSTVDLLSALPDMAMGPVSTLNQLHFRSKNSANSTRRDKSFVF